MEATLENEISKEFNDKQKKVYHNVYNKIINS